MRVFLISERAFPSAEGRLTYSPHVFQAICRIAQTPGLRASDLNHHLGLVPTTTSSLITRLVARGLVVKRTHPDDGRAIALYLTEEGEAVHCAMHRQDLRNMVAVLSSLDAGERPEFVRLVRKIADQIEALDLAEDEESSRRSA